MAMNNPYYRQNQGNRYQNQNQNRYQNQYTNQYQQNAYPNPMYASANAQRQMWQQRQMGQQGQQMQQRPPGQQMQQRPQGQQMPQRPQGQQMQQRPQGQQMQQWPQGQQMPQMPQGQQMPQMPQWPQMPQMPQGLPGQQMQPGQQRPQGQPGQSAPIDPSVRYDALTDADRKLLGIKDDVGGDENPVPGQELPKAPGTEIFFNVTEEFLEKLCGAIQNAENGINFYEKLAKTAGKGSSKEMIDGFTKSSRQLSEGMNEVYKSFAGKPYELKEAEIATFNDFREALAFAVDEETRNFSDLCDIYEQMVDERQLKRINVLIYRKIKDLWELKRLEARN